MDKSLESNASQHQHKQNQKKFNRGNIMDKTCHGSSITCNKDIKKRWGLL